MGSRKRNKETKKGNKETQRVARIALDQMQTRKR